MNIVPVMLCKNEEMWIKHVVGALVEVFPHTIVADTGSTDSTFEQLIKMSAENPEKLMIKKYADLTPRDLGQCRAWLQQEAQIYYKATHVMLVDGDELYPVKYLRWLMANPMPENAMSGFTWGVECTELENGECWMYDVGCNRQAFIPADSIWKGEYPFESPNTYQPGHPTNHYWKSPDDTYHFYHLHQMLRSNKDQDVYIREQKRFQFSMQDHPEIKPAKFWLKNREEYKDDERK